MVLSMVFGFIGSASAYFVDDFSVRGRPQPTLYQNVPADWPAWIGIPGGVRQATVSRNVREDLPFSQGGGYGWQLHNEWPSLIGTVR